MSELIDIMYEKMSEWARGDFTLEGLDPKDRNYGEQLLNRLCDMEKNTLYTHYNYKDELDTVSYIDDIISDDDHISVKITYWKKYGQLSVYRSDKTHTGWNRYIGSHGMPITIDIRIDGDEDEFRIGFDIFAQGYSDNVVFEYSNSEWYYCDMYGNRVYYEPHNFGADELIISNREISNGIRYTIHNLIQEVMESLNEAVYDMQFC